MIYKDYDRWKIPLNTPIWACGFETNNSKETMGKSKKPVLGMITCNKRMGKFREFKKDGKALKQGSVSLYSRVFADTYEECVDVYNSLIEGEIKVLEDLIDKYKNEYIPLINYNKCKGGRSS